MRTTTDKKDNSIRVRVNDRLMGYLATKSMSRGISISEYIREIISKEMTEDGQRFTRRDMGGSLWNER